MVLKVAQTHGPCEGAFYGISESKQQVLPVRSWKVVEDDAARRAVTWQQAGPWPCRTRRRRPPGKPSSCERRDRRARSLVSAQPRCRGRYAPWTLASRDLRATCSQAIACLHVASQQRCSLRRCRQLIGARHFPKPSAPWPAASSGALFEACYARWSRPESVQLVAHRLGALSRITVGDSPAVCLRPHWSAPMMTRMQ